MTPTLSRLAVKVAMGATHRRGVSIIYGVTFMVLLSPFLQTVSGQARGMLGREFLLAPPFCSSERHLVVMLHPLKPCPSCHTTVTRSGFPVPHGLRRDGPRTWLTLSCHPNGLRPLALTSAFLVKSNIPTLAYLNLERDTAILTPVASLGRSFDPLTFHSAEYDHTFVSIAAAVENTTVELKHGPNMGGNSARLHAPPGDFTLREKFDLVLPRGGVIMITCQCDLSGLHVEGSRPLTVLAGSYSSDGNANVLVENVTPISTRGKLHVLPRGAWMNSTLQLLLAGEKREAPINMSTPLENRTLILPDSGILSTELDFDTYVSFTSSQPISVIALIAVQGGGHNLVTLTPVEQYPPFELCPRQVHLSHDFVAAASLWHDEDIKSSNNESFVSENVTAADGSPLDQVNNDTLLDDPPSDDLTSGLYENVMSTGSQRVILYNESFPQKAVTELASRRARFFFLYLSPTSAEEGQPAIFSSGRFLADLYHACVPSNTSTTVDDGIDNDCDGFVDEETPGERMDGDWVGVGDVGRGRRECPEGGGGGGGDSEVPLYIVGLSASGLAVLLSVGVALIATLSFILGNWLIDFARGGNSFRPQARVEPMEE